VPNFCGLINCQAGYYASKTGAVSPTDGCLECPKGTYSLEAATACSEMICSAGYSPPNQTRQTHASNACVITDCGFFSTGQGLTDVGGSRFLTTGQGLTDVGGSKMNCAPG